MLKAENLIPRQRLLVLSALTLVVMLMLLSRFFILQVYNYEQYKVKSYANIIRAQSIPAPRGLIYDRESNILVDNHPTYMLMAVPREMKSKDTVFQKLSKYIDLPEEVLRKNYQKYFRGRFYPTRLARELTIEQLSRVAEHQSELPGISYKQLPERYYPDIINAAHTLGYIREVDNKFLKSGNESEKYRIGDLIGWRGLEKYYEDKLSGIDGVRYLQVDAFGREVGTVSGHESIMPIPGEDLRLTIDSDLQKLVSDQMEGKVGAVIVSKPLTGEILAMGSYPEYPPELFTGITLDEEWDYYATNEAKPLINRITHGLYPPGSTFKPLMVLGLMHYNVVDTGKTITCSGRYRLGRRIFECWNPAGHGRVDMRKAIEQSCNVYFYNMIQLWHLDQWAEIARKFNFGSKSGIDLPSELQGTVPSPEFMNDKYGVRGWSRGHLLNIAIGQGDILVTPLQMMYYTNLLATKGVAAVPRLVEGPLELQSTGADFDDLTWDILHDYMFGVTHHRHGTGKAAQPRIADVVTYGKTGTSENPHGDPHAWFIGWAIRGDEMISVTILAENAGHGGDIAAPIAGKIFDLYFKKHQPVDMVAN